EAELQEGILAFEGGSRNKGTKGPKDWSGVLVLIRRRKRKMTKRGREFSISSAGVACVWGLCIYWRKRSLELKKEKIQRGRSEEEEEEA
ncbi:hypothetical protein MUK42_26223, partial [Musa troglodytarum]